MQTKTRNAILKLNTEEAIRKTHSAVHASNHPDKEEILELLDSRLDALNVGNALVENCDMSDFGDM